MVRRSWINRYCTRLRPSDKLTALWLLATAPLVCLFLPGYLERNCPSCNWWALAAGHAAGLAVVLILVPLAFYRTGRVVSFLRAWYPVLFVPLIYKELFYLVPAVNPNDVDPLLYGLELAVFGVSPAVWIQRFHTPLLTDFLALAYASFFFLPLLPALALYSRGSRQFDRFMFLLLLNYYGAFALYFLMPSIGPGLSLAGHYKVPLQGRYVANWIFDAIYALEGPQHDCFPSLHTQISFVVAAFLYQIRSYTCRFTAPLCVAIIVSTIYCRYHYVPDVIAGLLLSYTLLRMHEKLYRSTDNGQA